MTNNHTRVRLLILTATPDSPIVVSLQDKTSLQARVVTPEGTPSSDEGLRRVLEQNLVDVVVIVSNDRAWVKGALETVGRYDSTIGTVVAPTEGSERLAALALRAGADEYISSTTSSDTRTTLRERVEAMVAERTEDRRLSSGTVTELLATTLPDEAFVIDENGTYLEARVRPDSADLYTVSADELVGQTIREAFSDELAKVFAECIDRALETNEAQTVEYEVETTGGTRHFEGRVAPIDREQYGRPAVVWFARDITDRADRERALRQRRDYLESLGRINAVVHRVIRTLVEAPTQSAIERDVCELLVESDLYCGSWIAEASTDNDIVFRAESGDIESYLEVVKGLEWTEERPIVNALQTNETQSSNRLQSDPRIPTAVREAAREHDVKSAIVVPIAHDETTYGVLTVLARRGDAFHSREEKAFKLLGETIGFSINAVRTRRLLFADAVTLLEFRIDGGNSLSFDLSKRYDCRCTLEWAGTAADGQTYQYVTVEGIDGQTVYDAATNHDSVDACRLINDEPDRATIEMRLRNSAVRTLAGYGATIRDITVEDGVGRLTIEIPRSMDARTVVDALRQVYENTELVAKREVDRSVSTASERRNRLADRLTERQLTTLRLAYHSGYFDWPRGSTGEEIADAMNISPPTMHQHLRKGLHEILDDFFEETHEL